MTERDWILVVDDDDDVRETILLLLVARGHRVDGAGDGQAALERIQQLGPPAGVLLDLRMPRMNGAEFVRAMRADPAFASVPIVVLSGDTGAGDVPPASAVLRKPCDLDELLAVIDRYMTPPTRT
jgi:CheY-like chemotaxis protein